MATEYFVLILKCTEAPVTTPTSTASTVAGEDTNMYEKIHMYQLNGVSDASFNELKNFNTGKTEKNENDNNHAIIFITLTNGEIDTSDGYIEKKYFKDDDIKTKFISQIDKKNAKEMDCYQSTYEVKNITPSTDQTYKTLTLGEPTTPATANILINNGGKIVVTSSKNDDLIILHYVSKMFGFEDIIGQLDKDLTATVRGGASLDDFEEEFTDTQAQNQIQEGGMKRKTKQNTRKKK